MTNAEAGALALLVLALCTVGVLLSYGVGKFLDRISPF